MGSGTAEPRVGDLMRLMRLVYTAHAAPPAGRRVRGEVGRRARRFVAEELSPPRVVDAMAARLAALLQPRPAPGGAP
jgi:hypothetical protein